MVIAADAPIVAKGFIHIGVTATIGVLQACHFGALDGIKIAVFFVVADAEDFVQPGRPFGEFDVDGRIGKGAFDEIDVAAAGADGNLAVGQYFKPTAFENDVLRNVNRDDFVKLGLGRFIKFHGLWRRRLGRFGGRCRRGGKRRRRQKACADHCCK